MATKKKTKKKKTTKKKLAPRMSKSKYILQHPKLSAQELVEQGQKDGVEFSDKYVYTIRSNAKTKKQRGRPTSDKKAGKVGRPRKISKEKVGKVGRPRKISQEQTSESTFSEIVMQIGFNHAEELLKRIRTAASSIGQ
jgi:hypothetical protein